MISWLLHYANARSFGSLRLPASGIGLIACLSHHAIDTEATNQAITPCFTHPAYRIKAPPASDARLAILPKLTKATADLRPLSASARPTLAT